MQKKQSSTPLLPIIIIMAVIIGGLFFLFKPGQETSAPPAPHPPEKITSPAPNDVEPREDIATEENLPVTGDQQPPLRLAPMEATLTNPCLEASQRLDLFFSYLDEQEYIQTYQFPHNSKEVISKLINTLLASPPVINGKPLTNTDILRNTAHLYRTLGAQNLSLLSKIIENEADLMEETCGSFQEWFNISPECLNQSYPLRPSLEQLYEYASFFLETTGGRAYLARRPGNLRLLGQYYSVLIIHQAQQHGLNKYHIKLDSLLPLLIGEIEASEELAAKNNYLAALYDIRAQLSEPVNQQL